MIAAIWSLVHMTLDCVGLFVCLFRLKRQETAHLTGHMTPQHTQAHACIGQGLSQSFFSKACKDLADNNVWVGDAWIASLGVCLCTALLITCQFDAVQHQSKWLARKEKTTSN